MLLKDFLRLFLVWNKRLDKRYLDPSNTYVMKEERIPAQDMVLRRENGGSLLLSLCVMLFVSTKGNAYCLVSVRKY